MSTKLTLEWSASGQDDLPAIFDVISEDSPQAALDLLDEIVEKVNMLSERPKMHGLSPEQPATGN